MDMTQIAFHLFEGLTALLFFLCAWHAVRQDQYALMELVAGLVYGVALELMTLRQLEAYHYGTFLVMLDGAPLAVGMGWAVIIYAGMQFSRGLDAPIFIRPLVSGLLALNIDLSMDAVAIRLGFWTWGTGALDFEWFGVPWGNFWAWFIVVTSFSGLLEMFTLYGWKRHPVRRWLYVPLSLVLSVVILAATNALYASFLWPNALGFTGMLLLIGLALLLVIRARPRASVHQIDPVVFLVPATFHLFFTVAGFAHGIYRAQPILGVVGVLMLLIGLGVHLWPALRPESTSRVA
ncbi:MAG: carotenoid biosynthesis protein [Anaerolineae bacterium]